MSEIATIPAASGPAGPEKSARAVEIEWRLRRVERMEKWLDREFRVLGMPVGFDGILGLVPVAGDTVSGALSAWIIWEAHKAGAGTGTKGRMIWNAGLDYVIGLVPIVGQFADFFHKANTKNVRLLKEHLAAEHRRETGGASLT